MLGYRRDEGPGIPADLKEKVLQPFFTTKPQGNGLGLAIVAKRVAELGGELKVISPASNGPRHKMRGSYLAFFASPQQRRSRSGG